MRKQPYIGMTGVTTTKEAEAVVEIFEKTRITMETNHIPMIGILVSDKTVQGLESIEPPGDKRYPDVGNICDILEEIDGKAFATIHYNTEHKETLANEIEDVLMHLECGRDTLGGFQFNIHWPPISEIGKIKNENPELDLILSLTRSAMKGKTPAELGKRVAEYEDSVDYVLIDPSGGRGEELDIRDCAEVFKGVWTQNNKKCIGIAGGLSGANVESVCTQFMGEVGTAHFSIDAEEKLRDKFGPNKHDTKLNIKKFGKYALEARKVLVE